MRTGPRGSGQFRAATWPEAVRLVADGLGAVRERHGTDVAVIVSDSFGRPWRWGIVDVAIGVSGLAPVEDLRGTPDADGRVMRSTIRATADEIASAAELALGKTARRPVAIVRGARPTRADGSIGDVVMPRAFDLFP